MKRRAMTIAVITGSAGLIGAEAARFFADKGAGDHIWWWICDIHRFQAHYHGWSMRYDIDAILREIFEALSDRALRSEVR